MLLLICVVPLTILLAYLLIMTNKISSEYDGIVRRITKANAYNINFKEDMDYVMYIIVVNSERAEELVDTEQPHRMIQAAREVFGELYEEADSEYAANRLSSILKSLDTLEDRVEEIEKDALVTGLYETNMERLDLNIRVLTELIQEQIQYYIYYETTNMEELRMGIRADVESAITAITVILVLILLGAWMVSRRIVRGITEPIQRLCEAAQAAGSGDFAIRAQDEELDELSVLNSSFNQMVEEIGHLVEDIRVEELNLRAAELRVLQEQINPHFLYNTLDNIIWLAESKDTEQVVRMVSSLSSFFRTTLSKGREFITVKEEEQHIRSYLEIQQFRYRDILEYEIAIPEELYEYEIIKLTLQPLVENALYHGIKNKRGGGHIRVCGALCQDVMIFKVQDDGIGMDGARLAQVCAMLRDGEQEPEPEETGGFGLFNVNQRIQLNYGREYGLKIQSTYGQGTEIWVRIPCRAEKIKRKRNISKKITPFEENTAKL